MKSFFLFALFISVSLVFSQKNYNNCDIKFTDNTTKSGKCVIPSFPRQNGFYFKENDKERMNIESKSVERLKIITKSNNTYVFDYLPVAEYRGKLDSIVVHDRSQWLKLHYSTDYMNTYARAQNYIIKRNGELELTSTNLIGNHPITFYLKKKRDDFAFYVVEYSDISVKSRDFKKNIYHYLISQPEIYQIVNKRNLEWHRINEVAELYSWYQHELNKLYFNSSN